MTAFRPMLASAADFSILRFPLYASPKLDGIRCVIKDGRPVTRKLLAVPNKFIKSVLSNSDYAGLDGELITGSPTADDVYRKTNSAVMSHEGEPIFTFHCFDHVVMQDICSFESRLRRVEKIVKQINRSFIRAHEHEFITDEAGLLAYETKCVEAGYEGIIIRGVNEPYKYGRSTAREQGMLKVKRFEDSEAEVLSWVQEMHNANTAERDELGRTKRSKAAAGLVAKDTMGALQVRDLKTGVEFEIGTGFTASDRLLKDWKGLIVKYKHFPIGVKDKPRHPVYLGRRDKRDMS